MEPARPRLGERATWSVGRRRALGVRHQDLAVVVGVGGRGLRGGDEVLEDRHELGGIFHVGEVTASLHDLQAAALDGGTRWQVFRSITWPLIWPVTVLCLTIQLILQLKIFDQVYLFAMGGRTAATMVLVQYIFEQAFQKNSSGYASTIAVALFVIVVAFSVLQYQLLKVRGGEK